MRTGQSMWGWCMAELLGRNPELPSCLLWFSTCQQLTCSCLPSSDLSSIHQFHSPSSIGCRCLSAATPNRIAQVLVSALPHSIHDDSVLIGYFSGCRGQTFIRFGSSKSQPIVPFDVHHPKLKLTIAMSAGNACLRVSPLLDWTALGIAGRQSPGPSAYGPTSYR